MQISESPSPSMQETSAVATCLATVFMKTIIHRDINILLARLASYMHSHIATGNS